MHRATIAPGLAALLTAALASSSALGQDDAPAFPARPTAEHEVLKGDVGTWDAEIKTYMNGPDAPPEVSKGVETNRMLGDLWLISAFEGTFGGMPFSGHSQIGFDPRVDRFVMTWVDSVSTTMMSLTGTYDAETKTLTMTGKAFDPMLDKEVEQKAIGRTIDDDHRVFVMYMKAPEYGDDWIKGMEIQYTRRPSGSTK
ncbi:DUF1579 domain-containing protein [Tautonia sociabilis]|uniref:DUF1579 domain-containing protein n=1 Tax=Tautonia sociabilis TaxID=2080755 RepID=A0A432MH30_9BACT|nr:DUF1579 domain-containing protein [Tautonia sociabilis]RUL86290.1 DUF1579 domain-containing protein [Tautonia sociabilis]